MSEKPRPKGLRRATQGRAAEVDHSAAGGADSYLAPDEPDIAAAHRASFEEDHSLGKRSWGKGRHSSIPKTHGAEGRNWAGD